LFALQGVVSLKLKPEVSIIYHITILSDTAEEQRNEEDPRLAQEYHSSGQLHTYVVVIQISFGVLNTARLRFKTSPEACYPRRIA